MTMLSSRQVRASHGGQNKDKALLQHSQRCHKGGFWHSEGQPSRLCGQNLCGHFIRAVLATNVEESDRTMAANGMTIALVFHHQGEFQPNYCTVVSLHDSDHDGVVRIFVALSCEL